MTKATIEKKKLITQTYISLQWNYSFQSHYSRHYSQEMQFW